MTASATEPTPLPTAPPAPRSASRGLSPARPTPRPVPAQEFQLVETSDGWRLTMTLTDRLREALARGGDPADLTFTVRIAPNLVPGEPFEAQLVIAEPGQRA